MPTQRRNIFTYIPNNMVSSIVEQEACCRSQEEPIRSVSLIEDNSNNHSTEIKSNICFICGDPAKKTNKANVYYCPKHFQMFFQKCDSCHEFYDKKDINNIQQSNLCCYFLNSMRYNLCTKCKKWNKHCTIIQNSGVYCKKCLSDIKYFNCQSCGSFYLYERYGKNNRCVSCINSHLTQVRNYSYKPVPRFFKKQNIIDDELYFGVQLQMGQVQNYQTVNDFVAEYSNSFFYMKKDTSIPVYGCEIVTQPATMSKHIDSRYWKTMLNVAKQYGFNADNEKCGIHIHISRNFFTNYEIAKLDCFVNTYSFFKKIARRQSHYSEYLNKPCDSWGSQISNRKCALNLSNSNTVQMRIFKGTLQHEYIMAYIQFCHAISVFIKSIQMDEILNSKKTTISKFVKLIESCKYKYIMGYCQKFHVFDSI